ncbi:A24 family peptidase [Micromonospora sp. NPDC049559]|uniref:A24 family peptidase n=1 Tax=Micromonospora sp. NPDC049559 TaxID=3155923 RepID=UPI00341DD8A9
MPRRRPVRWAALPAVAPLLLVAPLLRWVVATEAVPSGRSRRTACDRCRTPLGPRTGLRPLSPAARCAACGARIGAAPLLLELVLLAAGAVLVLAGRPVLESIALAWWVLCAVPLLFVDVAVHRLPDRLTYGAAAGTWGLLGLAAWTAGGDGRAWVRAVLAGAGVALLFAASTLLLGRRGFGLGDAKLALSGAALLGWYGWGAVLLGLLLAFAGSAVVSLVLLATGRIRWSGHLPFGPFLIFGVLAVLALPPA